MKIERLNFDAQERPYSQAVRVGHSVYTSGASIGDPGDDIATQTTKTIDYLGRDSATGGYRPATCGQGRGIFGRYRRMGPVQRCLEAILSH